MNTLKRRTPAPCRRCGSEGSSECASTVSGTLKEGRREDEGGGRKEGRRGRKEGRKERKREERKEGREERRN